VLLPGHGLPIYGAEKVQTALLDTARYLETIYQQTLAMLNTGATIYDIIQSIRIPAELAERPFLQPVYDEPEFVARNIYRCLAGWYTGVPSELKPAPPSQRAREIATLAGGVDKLLARADALLEAGDVRMASHLVDWAIEATPDSAEAHQMRARVYAQRGAEAVSTMSRGIFMAAHRDSAKRGGK
jgi:alkyl sulfatase BDS1-like metallo-beta-lactamase superfamily hydrolase